MMVGIYCLARTGAEGLDRAPAAQLPIVDIPLAITGDDPTPTLRTSLLNNRLFWLGGFAVASRLSDRGLAQPRLPASSVRLHDIDVGASSAICSAAVECLVGPAPLHHLPGHRHQLPRAYRGVAQPLALLRPLPSAHAPGWGIFGVGPWEAGAAAVEPYTFHAFMEAGSAAALCGVILYRSRRALLRPRQSADAGQRRRTRTHPSPTAARCWASSLRTPSWCGGWSTPAPPGGASPW
jgi:hypothetical protein